MLPELLGPPAFGKQQHRIAVAEQFAHIAKRLPRSGFPLRQREGVEKCGRQPVVQAVGEPFLARELLGEKMRLEKFFRHRRRHARAPSHRQRGEYHRRIHVALVVGCENHRPLQLLEMFETLHRDPGKDTRERQEKNRLAHGADRLNRPQPIPSWKLHRLGHRLGGRRRGGEPLEIGNRRCAGERAFVDVLVQRFLERDHHLHAFERTEAKLLNRRPGFECSAAGVACEHGLDRVALRRGRHRRRALLQPRSYFVTLELSRAFSTRKFRGGPDGCASNALMVRQPRVGRAHDIIRRDARLQD